MIRALRITGLWVIFATVHAVLIAENLLAPDSPLGDVTTVYPAWWNEGLQYGAWAGLTTPGVYPFLSLIPIAVASKGVAAWFAFLVVLDGVAFEVLRRRNSGAALGWVMFQAILGPIALGRVDAVTVALGVVVITVIDSRPKLAGALTAIATWVKVWPIALAIAAFRSPQFGDFARRALGTAVALLVMGSLLGNFGAVLSFLGQQQGRGLQVESVWATPWLWNAAAHLGSVVQYNPMILTFEVGGIGTGVAAKFMSVAQALVIITIVALVLVARPRKGSPFPPSFVIALLALVSSLIAFNKVGSPQFVSWLAIPVVAILVAPRRERAFGPLVLIAVIAALTHVIFPYVYLAFLELSPAPLLLVTIRNIAELLLAVTSVIALFVQLRREKLAQKFADLNIVDEEGVVPEGR